MAGVEPYRQNWWDWRAAGNFMLGGTGSGLLIVAVVIVFLHERGVAVIIFLALGLVAAGLGLVWLEIGKRLRAMNVFRQPQMSWMTRESYAATGVFVFGGLAIWFDHVIAIVVAGVFGALFLYCQGRILLASKGIPAWREKNALPLIGITGLVEGISLAVLINFAILHPMQGVALPFGLGGFFQLSGFSNALVAGLGMACALGLIARYLVWRRYYAKFRKSAPIQALRVYDRFAPYFLIGGHVVPLAFIGLAMVAPSLSTVSFVIAAVCALGGGWGLKFVMITRASYTQGFAIPKRPARGPIGTGGPGVKPGWNTDR